MDTEVQNNKRIPWNTGLTKETSPSLAIMANNKRGKPSSRKGLTKETDASVASMALKISQLKKGKQPIFGAWNKGLTKETDERVASQFTSERSKKISNALTGREITWGEKLSKASIKRFTDPAQREVSRQTMLRNFQNPEWVKNLYKARNAKPNKAELKLIGILDKNFPNEWEYVGDGKMILAGKIPDFINVNGKKQVIELFGRYWHRGENPQDRIDLFKQFGFSTVIIMDNELKDERLIVERVQDFSSATTLHEVSNVRVG